MRTRLAAALSLITALAVPAGVGTAAPALAQGSSATAGQAAQALSGRPAVAAALDSPPSRIPT